ncbi:MAG TPA: Hsp20/alpha crystallin family protein [Candidatus Saccharimonadales bacterium]
MPNAKKQIKNQTDAEAITVHNSDASSLTDWMSEDNYEGELAVDVYQDADSLYVKAPVAGVEPDKLEVSINNDMLTIRGVREMEREVEREDYFYSECYWGGFSRSIILPVDVKAEDISAELQHGILTVTLPKLQRNRTIPIDIKDQSS